VNTRDLKALKLMGKKLLGYSAQKPNDAPNAGELIEVDNNE
jgi:hypothetical protein